VVDPVETKLSAARTRLILDRPFLGALVLRLPMVEAGSWCKTTATDAKSFFYNHDYIDALSLEQTQFMLAHDALHCALLHFARRQHREKHRWDVACDFAINPLLIQDGLKPPPDILYLKEYEGMTAEEIYPLIDDQLDQEPLDQHLYDEDSDSEDDDSQAGDSGLDEKDIQKQQQQDRQNAEKNEGSSSGTRDSDKGSGAKTEAEQNTGKGKAPPPPLKEGEKDELAVQWQQRMAGAAQTAMQAGKLGGGMARMVDHLLQPQLPWRMLLARSIVDDEMSSFVSEINAIKGQMRARVTLHACDAQMAENGPWIYEAWEEMQLPDDLQGGGGTDFCPAFEWANDADQVPDLLVYFTDAQGNFPKIEPGFPVIWLVKGKSPVPFGQRIQLN
jgi:predicted metal-dependent peptidase